MLQAEQATVQLALISDGRRSFGLVFYKAGAMRWAMMDFEPVTIGLTNGRKGEEVSNVYSDTAEAFSHLDRIKGNTGRSAACQAEISDVCPPHPPPTPPCLESQGCQFEPTFL